MTLRNRIIAATPIICLIIFLSIGYGLGVWNPTWVVFFLIPLMPVILSDTWVRNLYSFIAIAVYIALAAITGMWHPLWIILLTIPVYYILVGPNFGRFGTKKHEFKEKA